jgi:transposase
MPGPEHDSSSQKLELRFMRYELSDCEWSVIKPMLPNKPRGVPRVDDRRVLNGIFWVLRSGAPWRDLPEIYGPCTTCYGSSAGGGLVDKIMEALAAAHEAAVARGPFAWWIDQQGSCRC